MLILKTFSKNVINRYLFSNYYERKICAINSDGGLDGNVGVNWADY